MTLDFMPYFPTPLALGALALANIAPALYALLRGRPFIIHTRLALAIIVVAISPLLLKFSWLSFIEDRNRNGGLAIMYLILLTLLIVVCFAAFVRRGYTVFATTQESFRDALASTLSSLNLKYEEAQSSIRLPSVPAELKISYQGWMGTGQLHIRSGGRPGLLADVARGMNAYFNSAKVKTNMAAIVRYVIFGVWWGAMAVLDAVAPRPTLAVSPSALHAGLLDYLVIWSLNVRFS